MTKTKEPIKITVKIIEQPKQEPIKVRVKVIEQPKEVIQAVVKVANKGSKND